MYSESLAEDVNFVAICNYDHYANFIDFVSCQLLDVDKNISIPYMPDEDIKSIAVETLEKTSVNIKSCITIDSIKYIVNNILCAKIISTPDWVTDDLGYCDFKRNTIYISPQLELNSPRWRFTIAHEIGHYLLHKELCQKQYIDSITDNGSEISEIINDKTISRMEIQANKFAAFLLIPDELFCTLYISIHKRLGIRRFPKLLLDEQPCNIKDCMTVFTFISNQLLISVETVKIKLQTMNLLTIQKSTKKIGDLLR